MTTNFEFTPDKAGAENVDGQGHIHLHIDGNKEARVYGPWFYLGQLPEGKYTITTTLHGNDHSMLMKDGKPIEAMVTVGE